MVFRHLEILEAVAETGTFTGAAKKLFITQSAVSHAIAELERQAGTELFERLPKGGKADALRRFAFGRGGQHPCGVQESGQEAAAAGRKYAGKRGVEHYDRFFFAAADFKRVKKRLPAASRIGAGGKRECGGRAFKKGRRRRGVLGGKRSAGGVWDEIGRAHV